VTTDSCHTISVGAARHLPNSKHRMALATVFSAQLTRATRRAWFVHSVAPWSQWSDEGRVRQSGCTEWCGKRCRSWERGGGVCGPTPPVVRVARAGDFQCVRRPEIRLRVADVQSLRTPPTGPVLMRRPSLLPVLNAALAKQVGRPRYGAKGVGITYPSISANTSMSLNPSTSTSSEEKPAFVRGGEEASRVTSLYRADRVRSLADRWFVRGSAKNRARNSRAARRRASTIR
jgi:hypothetical protein